MNYTVVWQPTAQNQLADIWVNATDQAAVTRASAQVDALLGRSPDQVGEARSANRRVLFEPPLVVTFEIIEDDKQVRVLRVLRA